MNFIFVEIFFQNDTKKGKRKLENKLENINVKNFLIAVFITELRILKQILNISKKYKYLNFQSEIYIFLKYYNNFKFRNL